MSLFSRTAKAETRAQRERSVINYMGGISFELSPLMTLKMVSASSIFGEPQYYRAGLRKDSWLDAIYKTDPVFKPYCIFQGRFEGKRTSAIMEMLIDEALSDDFEGTLRWAAELRTDYLMRLNPQVIMVRAAIHPDRAAFNRENPGVFAQIETAVMARADEPSCQLAYFLYLKKFRGRNAAKRNLPNVLKRAWTAKLESLSRYAVHKYKDAEVGMINTVRLCHAHNEILSELMETGSVQVSDTETTWEMLRSRGTPWRKILETTHVGHMALLRNLRGIFREINDLPFCQALMDQLKDGVPGGKQFPFRYLQAHKKINGDSSVHHSKLILQTLEECMDIACGNMPHLKGKTMCLSDNSGSAWGAIPSEYGTVRVAEIGNLSSVITACNSDEGYVGLFGDQLIVGPVDQQKGILKQTSSMSNLRGQIGGGTENGIWLFFNKAIREKEHWDNIFIYSDMQAGHGGLYGTGPSIAEYASQGYAVRLRYVDVAKLIQAYRRKVNPKVNVFCIQTAGYTNVLVPEYGYRTNILYGWTGKELSFADTQIRMWDEVDEMNDL